MILPSLQFRGTRPLKFGGLGRVLRDPESHWSADILEHPVTRATAGGREILLVASPSGFKTVLSDRHAEFPRSRLHDRMIGLTFGDNLVSAPHADWQRQRRDLSPTFRPQSVERLIDRVEAACARQIDRWRALPAGSAVDLVSDMRLLALDSLWSSFFCGHADAGRLSPLVENTVRSHAEGAELLQLLEELRPLSEQAVSEPAGAFFEERAPETDREILFNTVQLFLEAGHDNAAATLAWAIWLLACHPESQEHVRREWRASRARTGAEAALPYTTAVIRETLRLYPPIMYLVRDTGSDTELEGVRVKRGTPIVLNMYAMHRNRRYWDKPDDFDPKRFLEPPRERMVWSPFGAGPRICLGMSFAMMEMVGIVARLTEHFRFNAGTPLRPVVDFALRPSGKTPISLRPTL